MKKRRSPHLRLQQPEVADDLVEGSVRPRQRPQHSAADFRTPQIVHTVFKLEGAVMQRLLQRRALPHDGPPLRLVAPQDCLHNTVAQTPPPRGPQAVNRHKSHTIG